MPCGDSLLVHFCPPDRSTAVGGQQPAARILGQPSTAGCQAGSQSPGIDGSTPLPRLPGPVDCGFERGTGRRHARPRAASDCRGREARCHPRMARRALRSLDQLQANRRAGGMAALACSDRPAADGCMAHSRPHQAEGAWVMGWGILIVLISVSLGLLWLLGNRGGLLTASAAALLLGASGYALQGRPGLPGAPARAEEAGDVFPLTDARHAFFGNFTPAESWLRISEALARDGKSEDAVGILQNAVRRYPGDPQLWIGLGNALVDHAHGLTPPAELAYRRANGLNSGPAASFFYGLALARSGHRDEAVAIWRDILDHTPKTVSWRPQVEQGVA